VTATAPGRAVPSRLHPALRAALALLSLCVAWIAGEAAARWCWTPPPWFQALGPAGLCVTAADGDVVLKPGFRGAPSGDGDTAIAVNSLGMRGPEPGPKAAGDRRLLVLGDEVVLGAGVGWEQTFVARLSGLLSTETTPCLAGNGGVPGHGSTHAAAHMARLAAPFSADAFVVCGSLGDDALDDAAPERVVHAGLLLQGPWARLVRSSLRARLLCRSRAALWLECALPAADAAAELPARLLDPDAAGEASIAFPSPRLADGLFLDAVDEGAAWDAGAPPRIPRSLATLRGALERMRGQADGRPLVFVVVPTLWQVVEELRVARLRERGTDPATTARGLAQRRWLDTAKSAGVQALDATPILAAALDPAAMFLADGRHFAAAGHEAVTAWLAQELARLWR